LTVLFPKLNIAPLTLDPSSHAPSHALPIVNPSSNVPSVPGIPTLPAPEGGIIYTPGQVNLFRPIGITDTLDTLTWLIKDQPGGFSIGLTYIAIAEILP
jgi:hypothetical protein